MFHMKIFFIHLENCFVLQECGIPLETLVYRDQLDIADILKTTRVTTSLVDHHVLSKHDQILESTVTQIFDHRPIDPSTDWNKRNVKLKIEEVGSCSTLIAAEIFKVDENILSKEMAYLIYETMIYDTVALLPENGRAKELDLTIAKKLEEKFSFTEGRIAVFEKILEAHNNVSQLTPSQMLMKDLKIVDNIPVPGLPMLVQNFLKIDAAYNAIENFAAITTRL
ncbi:hypothetical protein NQ318_007287 [Aromia moschata]|uniref:DHHA2 domain-containing protein n=1 Tax=Aromia moschata TaxID=1265417 RepID=A0AAV8YZT4_9CUCU|nr:hypothetical protein NQ318_007287 [Aromia moschata]